MLQQFQHHRSTAERSALLTVGTVGQMPAGFLVTRFLVTGLVLVACLMVAALLVTVTGCGSKTATDSVPDTFDGMSAEQFLQSVFTKYRTAQSYRDRGEVRLTYDVGGKQQVETAPLTVWYDREALYVKAYDVRLQSDPVAFVAWIKDPTTADFDSQVVRTAPLLHAPTVEDLLSDAVLSEKMSAGLAGPPPQLEWLFALEPMKRLFVDGYQIEFAEQSTIQNIQYVIVRVQADEEEYRFWIDPNERVIRRVNLPPVLAPPQYSTGESGAESMRLTLELEEATFAPAKEQAKMDQLPRSPRFVRQFIALPPVEPPAALGKEPAAFQTRDQTGQIALSQRGADRDVTVLFAATDTQANWNALLTTSALVHWNAMMSADLLQRVRVGIVVDETSFRQLPSDLGLPLFMDGDRLIRSSLNLQSGDLAMLDREGRIVWFQRAFTANDLSRLGLIVGDVLDGVNVPARLRDQWRSDRNTYESVLDAEVARASPQ